MKKLAYYQSEYVEVLSMEESFKKTYEVVVKQDLEKAEYIQKQLNNILVRKYEISIKLFEAAHKKVLELVNILVNNYEEYKNNTKLYLVSQTDSIVGLLSMSRLVVLEIATKDEISATYNNMIKYCLFLGNTISIFNPSTE